MKTPEERRGVLTRMIKDHIFGDPNYPADEADCCGDLISEQVEEWLMESRRNPFAVDEIENTWVTLPEHERLIAEAKVQTAEEIRGRIKARSNDGTWNMGGQVVLDIAAQIAEKVRDDAGSSHQARVTGNSEATP